jgi:hypothetical protein
LLSIIDFFCMYKKEIFFWFFLVNCILLGIIGGKPIDYPYLIFGRMFTFFYFYYFFILLYNYLLGSYLNNFYIYYCYQIFNLFFFSLICKFWKIYELFNKFNFYKIIFKLKRKFFFFIYFVFDLLLFSLKELKKSLRKKIGNFLYNFIMRVRNPVLEKLCFRQRYYKFRAWLRKNKKNFRKIS